MSRDPFARPMIWLTVVLLFACRPAPVTPVEVHSVEPGFAVQGAGRLDVTVTGSGFEPGAEIRVFVSGSEDTGGVTVSSTRFVAADTLVGSLDVAAAATTGTYDVEVHVGDRTGKGVEVFGIVPR